MRTGSRPEVGRFDDDAVASLRRFVADRGLDAELLTPNTPMPTVPLAAAAIGVSPEVILKSLLFRDRAGTLVLAIASGTAKVDRDRLAAVAGLDRPRLADAATVLAATGFPAGGVAPIGHRTPFPVVLDRRAAALAVAYGGGGSEHALLRVIPADIVRLTGAVVADITGATPEETR